MLRHVVLALLVGSVAFAKPVEKKSIGPLWDNHGQVVFLGDSITDWWRNDGRQTWEQFYAALGSVNTGVAGDRTTTIIDRINGGMIDNLNAYMAVLKIGTNDLSGNVPVQTVADNIAVITGMIKQKNPGVRILLLGILPRGGSEIHGRIKTVNSIISQYADGSTVFYLDMEQQFSTGQGQVVPELYWDDQLHLSSAGYAMWAQTMNSLFFDILGRPFPAKAVWLGDSLTYQWGTYGRSVWDQHFAGIESLNLGVSGHKSSDTINLLNSGALDGLNSKAVLLLIGGNDLADGIQATEVIRNIETIINLIRTRLAHERILLACLLPAGGYPETVVEQGLIVNGAIRAMANFDDIHVLDMTMDFGDSEHNIHEEYYQADQTHLSTMGYQLWQSKVQDRLNSLLQFAA